MVNSLTTLELRDKKSCLGGMQKHKQIKNARKLSITSQMSQKMSQMSQKNPIPFQLSELPNTCLSVQALQYTKQPTKCITKSSVHKVSQKMTEFGIEITPEFFGPEC